jgi:hypothetical protein
MIDFLSGLGIGLLVGVVGGVVLDFIYSKRVLGFIQGVELSIKSYIDAKLK